MEPQELENTAVLTEVTDPAEVAPVDTPAADEPKATGRSAADIAFDKLLEAKSEAKQEEKAEVAPEAKTEVKPEVKAETTEEKGLAPDRKGPNSWKVEVREKFRTLPPEVQSEVMRRENEHQKLMQETADVRKFASEFVAATQPYDAYLRSANVSPIAAYKDLLNTAYTLRTGTPGDKATVIANIIKHNSVDLETLNQVLMGQEVQKTDPAVAALQQELAALRNERNAEVQAKQAEFNGNLESVINTFATDPANEFVQDVAAEMQLILANTPDDGRNPAEVLKEAYDKACWLNAGVRAVIQGRAVTPPAQVTQTATAPSVQAKLKAASSVKGAPSPTRAAPVKKQLSGREAALAAWELHEQASRV